MKYTATNTPAGYTKHFPSIPAANQWVDDYYGPENIISETSNQYGGITYELTDALAGDHHTLTLRKN